jgi:hypothetical protein
MTQPATAQLGTMAAIKKSEESSPFIAEFFMVESAGFKGMGYKDCEGYWRSAYNHVLLLGQVHISE